MVRLKVGAFKITSEVSEMINGFNSTMVRLKAGFARTIYSLEIVTLFQFHNGSIKSGATFK